MSRMSISRMRVIWDQRKHLYKVYALYALCLNIGARLHKPAPQIVLSARNARNRVGTQFIASAIYRSVAPHTCNTPDTVGTQFIACPPYYVRFV
jgi:hypothetical protein